MSARDETLDERQQLRARFGELFALTAALLYKHNPAGINFEVNPDEYENEAATILPRLETCHSVEDVFCVVTEEFDRWFGLPLLGRHLLPQIAAELWQLWQEHRGQPH